MSRSPDRRSQKRESGLGLRIRSGGGQPHQCDERELRLAHAPGHFPAARRWKGDSTRLEARLVPSEDVSGERRSCRVQPTTCDHQLTAETLPPPPRPLHPHRAVRLNVIRCSDHNAARPHRRPHLTVSEVRAVGLPPGRHPAVRKRPRTGPARTRDRRYRSRHRRRRLVRSLAVGRATEAGSGEESCCGHRHCGTPGRHIRTTPVYLDQFPGIEKASPSLLRAVERDR